MSFVRPVWQWVICSTCVFCCIMLCMHLHTPVLYPRFGLTSKSAALKSSFALLTVVGHAQASLPRPWVHLDLALATLVLAVMITVPPEDKRLQSQQSRNPVQTAGQPFDYFCLHASLFDDKYHLIWEKLLCWCRQMAASIIIQISRHRCHMAEMHFLT